jgi:uncharacterized coiled-coil protein SlyX
VVDNAGGEYQGNGSVVAERLGTARPPGPPLPPPPGDRSTNGMEARIARLEADVGHIKTDIADIKQSLRALQTDVSSLKVDFARLDERVKHLPTFNQTIGMLVVLLGLIGAITLFQDNIRRAIGAAPLTAVPPVTVHQ